MPQTDPFHSVVPRKLTDAELARAIRLDIEAELDAINLYAAHVEATDNEDARRVLAHIMDEEKEHAALFLELILRLDPAQAGHSGEAAEKLRRIVAGAPKEEIEAAGEGDGEEAPPEGAKQFTVGPLRRS